MVNVGLTDGYTNFCGIDCIYSICNEEIRLIPASKEDIGDLYKRMPDQQFLFRFSDDVDKNCLAYIDRTAKSMGSSFTLYPKYLLRLMNSNPVTSMQFTGSSIDEIFHPADYYYMKKDQERKMRLV